MSRWWILVLTAARLGAQDAQPGKVVDRVLCRQNERQSYALFVPSGYTADRAWPIVYCLDPGARGRVPVERFAAAAEKLGYLVAGSNNSRNGPMGASIEAIEAMVVDTHMRLAIDDRRLYAAGHSGGAMVALQWGRNGKLAGVVASGSVHPVEGLPQHGFRLFLSAGVEDFAYYPAHAASRETAKRGIENRFREFEGGHEWLPADAAEEALRFFSGELPPQPAPDSKEVRSLAARFDQMSSQLFRAEEGERVQLARQYAREAQSGKPMERRLARQVITSASIAYAEDAREKMAKKDYLGAARALEANVLMRPENGGSWYSLAIAQAGAGNKRRALECLEKAAANGFRDAARVEREPLLEPVRGDRRYRAAVEAMGKNGSQ